MTEREIFTAALNKGDPADRAAYLTEVCGDDAELRQRVESLLAEHEQLGSFLESPSPTSAATIDRALNGGHRERLGTRIGPYKLLQQIGEGGMGTVYMAEQTEPLRRFVAIKVIKAGMDSQQVLARFDAERQALALMDHPNIAKVFDAGTTENGRPYFVMELVKGIPITKYCDDNHLSPRERLQLMVPVCQAIQHAHQKGIIHRDIKPSNILIAQYDGQPVAKVIDFGVAKAAGPQLTERTMFTELGQIVGTLEYMSPEQAELNQLDIDTRSDIYSLGVLFYELLTGSTPFDRKSLQSAAFDEMLRIIREDEPPRPSTKLSSSDALPSVAANRHSEPAKLTRLVRGELDWIVMKCLEKDRGRRYETANSLARDIERYLNDESVQACPPSAWYQFRKFVRWNRAGLATAGLLSVALLVATSGIGWSIRDRSAHRADMERQRVTQELEVERERAARQAKLEGKISESLNEVQAAYERDNLPESLAAVKQAERLLASDDVGHDELRQRVHHWQAELDVLRRLDDLQFLFSRAQSEETDADYANIFRDLGIDVDELPVEEAGKRIRSHVTWQRLTEALDRWVGVRHEKAWLEKSRITVSASAASAVYDLENVRKRRLLQVARAADADELRSQARLAVEAWDVATAERLANSPEATRLPAATLRQLAMVVYYGGGNARRENAIRVLENARCQRPGDFKLNHACAIYCEQIDPPRWAEAAHYWSVALAIRPNDARVQFAVAYDDEMQNKDDDAFAGFRRVIELDPQNAAAHNELGILLKHQGKTDEAMASFRRAIQADPNRSAAHSNLGLMLKDQGKLDEAIACCRQAIQLEPKRPGAHVNLGLALKDQGKPDEAIACYRQAIRLDPKIAWAHFALGFALKEQGKRDEAIASYRQAIQSDPKMASAHYNLGLALRDQGKPDDANACFLRAIELGHKLSAEPSEQSSESRQQRATMHQQLATWLIGRGKRAEAVLVLEKLVAENPQQPEFRFQLSSLHHDLAVLLEADKRPDQAEAEFRKALKVAEQAAAALPENVKAWETIGHRTRYLGGFLRRSNRLADAEPAYAQGVRAFETARTLPGASDASERCFIADTRRMQADAILAQNRPAEAEVLYRAAVEGIWTLPAEMLQQADRRTLVNNSLSQFIKFLRLQGRPQDAAGVIQQAIEFYSRLSTELPQEGAFLQEISRLRAEAAELTKEKSDNKTPEPAKKAEAKPTPNP